MSADATIGDRILAAALARARASGYDGFSFRDIAADVGIKSASVHYHFPTKADLVAAVMDRYRTDFLAALGDASRLTSAEAVERLAGLFRAAAAHEQACLCAALGVTASAVPDQVRRSVAAFAEHLMIWLDAANKEDGAKFNSSVVLALLEGALMLSNLKGDVGIFDEIASSLHTK